MVNLKELECPRECPKRSTECHWEGKCERHKRYREETERRRRERFLNNTVSESLSRNINRKEGRFTK